LRYQWKEILIAGGALASLFSLFYMGTSFFTSYATDTDYGLGHSRAFVLSMGMVAAVVFAISIAASAMWSDKIGRRKVIMVSCTLAVLWALIVFPVMYTGRPTAFLIVTQVIFGIVYGPAGADPPALYQARYRYSGSVLGYNRAGILGGAIPPLFAAGWVAQGGVLYVGIMLAALSAVSVVCTYFLVESRDTGMGRGDTTPSGAQSLGDDPEERVAERGGADGAGGA